MLVNLSDFLDTAQRYANDLGGPTKSGINIFNYDDDCYIFLRGNSYNLTVYFQSDRHGPRQHRQCTPILIAHLQHWLCSE